MFELIAKVSLVVIKFGLLDIFPQSYFSHNLSFAEVFIQC